jgi:hypothetical protein
MYIMIQLAVETDVDYYGGRSVTFILDPRVKLDPMLKSTITSIR